MCSGERELAENALSEFRASGKCQIPDISSFLGIEQWIRASLFLLEATDSKTCGMEMACTMWESLGRDELRMEALRQHPQMLVLLQACVHASDLNDWSFLER